MAREFEKAVELLSVHFNVDEDKAKRMVEYAFAKTENAGADVCVDDKNDLNYHHEIKIPNYHHELQLPVYDFSLNEPACEPPIIKGAVFEEHTCCGNPDKNGFTSSSGLKELPIERTGHEFDCRINIESVTINVSSEADISSIAKELNQLAGMKIRKGGMGA